VTLDAPWSNRCRVHADGRGDDGDELRGYWKQLSDGGTVSVPLEKQMWGDEFGMCDDRFGVTWMVNIGPPQT
jgi:PhnB protein